eukprot:654442-Pyramimonas_sp.AAC.1
MPLSFARLVPAPVICPSPLHDWFPLRVDAPLPRAVGRSALYTPLSFARLVPVPGICPSPSRGWSPLRVYSLFPAGEPIGEHRAEPAEEL